MSPDEVKESYVRMMEEAGEDVIYRRYYGAGQNRPFFDAVVRARVVGYVPNEMIDGTLIKQGDRRLILLADALLEAEIPPPIRSTDVVVVRNRELAIIRPDDSTRRIDGELIAYELVVRG